MILSGLLSPSCTPTSSMEIGTVASPMVSIDSKNSAGRCRPANSMMMLTNATIVLIFKREASTERRSNALFFCGPCEPIDRMIGPNVYK